MWKTIKTVWVVSVCHWIFHKCGIEFSLENETDVFHNSHSVYVLSCYVWICDDFCVLYFLTFSPDLHNLVFLYFYISRVYIFVYFLSYFMVVFFCYFSCWKHITLSTAASTTTAKLRDDYEQKQKQPDQ